MKNRFLLFSLLLTLGCNNSQQNSQTEPVADSKSVVDSVSSAVSMEKNNALDNARLENIRDTSIVYLIAKPCAINFEPDTARMNEERKKMSDEDWNTVIDDWMYYNSETTQALEKNGIDVTNLNDERRYLKFIKTNNQEYTIDRKKIDGFYAFVLFNGIDDPVLLNITNAEAEVKDYFNK